MLPKINPTKTKVWEKLENHMVNGENHPIHESGFLLSKQIESGISFNYLSRLWNSDTLDLLLELAEECKLTDARNALYSGEIINETEHRAVLHTALRDFTQNKISKENIEINFEIVSAREKMKLFVDKVHDYKVFGATGKSIQHIVNIGIGGSELGPKFVIDALHDFKQEDLQFSFLSSIDIEPLGILLKEIDIERTLFVVVSKTFTTLETMTNAQYIKELLIQKFGTGFSKHFIGVTANTQLAIEFGIDEENVFQFWDWVGGRFSMWSCVGISIALAIGYENYLSFLKGAEEMDIHFKETPLKDNIPVIHALHGVWNTNFLNCQTQAIIPYNERLRFLKMYLQQIAMESNGKSVDRNGKKVNYATCPIIWGELGNNAQHSFFQLLHQGTHIVPVDFILIKNEKKGREDYNELLKSNYYAQIQALVEGRDLSETKTYLKSRGDFPEEMILHRVFDGKKPVVNIELEELNPFVLGNLLAFYEHVYFVQGIIWNIYSFDQWGVELGKELAKGKVKGFQNS